MMISKKIAASFLTLCVLSLAACKPENDKVVMYDGKPLDPLCVAGSAEPGGENLKECTGSLNKTDDTMSAKGLETFEDGSVGYTFDCPDGCMREPFVSYKVAGKVPQGYVLKVTSSGGGTGVFSDVRVVNVEGDTLKQTIITGGDRCNGGIDNVSVAKGTIIQYGQNVTPFDLVELSGGNKVDFEAYDDIAACAACCIGVAQYEDKELVGVNLTMDAMESTEGMGPIDTCFYGVYNDIVRAGNLTLNREAIDEFGASFSARCSDLKAKITAHR